jgi:hypothetical protein
LGRLQPPLTRAYLISAVAISSIGRRLWRPSAEAGRLAKALAVQELCLSIGYLHSDKTGRNSLVWDAIEPLRPAIDAKVFEFIAEYEFARSDFPQAGANVFRLSRDVTQLLLHRASLRLRDIESATIWMVALIMRTRMRTARAPAGR